MVADGARAGAVDARACLHTVQTFSDEALIRARGRLSRPPA
ncbi:hypothetical protein I552_9893 [Mycobacterium xenopi 3993]|nr:hypothetical protein I552_9893 [Mycobacterium xenopi 3993]